MPRHWLKPPWNPHLQNNSLCLHLHSPPSSPPPHNGTHTYKKEYTCTHRPARQSPDRSWPCCIPLHPAPLHTQWYTGTFTYKKKHTCTHGPARQSPGGSWPCCIPLHPAPSGAAAAARTRQPAWCERSCTPPPSPPSATSSPPNASCTDPAGRCAPPQTLAARQRARVGLWDMFTFFSSYLCKTWIMFTLFSSYPPRQSACVGLWIMFTLFSSYPCKTKCMCGSVDYVLCLLIPARQRACVGLWIMFTLFSSYLCKTLIMFTLFSSYPCKTKCMCGSVDYVHSLLIISLQDKVHVWVCGLCSLSSHHISARQSACVGLWIMFTLFFIISL